MELTKKQHTIIKEVFKYQDSGEITKQEDHILRDMFDTPEKFVLLRKILRILSPDERGLTMPSRENEIVTSDYESLGRLVEMNRMVDERIRGALLHLYVRIKGELQEEKREEFEKLNTQEFEEQKNKEKFEENKKRNKKSVGVNL